MSGAKSNNLQDMTTKLKPSDIYAVLHAMAQSQTPRAPFIWGPPGISKSAIAQQAATDLGMAFADVRLSQMDPTDLRGIPFPTEIGGVEGITWSSPLVLPRNLDTHATRSIEAAPTVIRFYNPKGSNGLYYCASPNFAAQSLTPGLTAVVLSVSADRAIVGLTDGTTDSNGETVYKEGKIAYSVTGDVRVVVALEEFNSAPPAVVAASYQLILDRRLGEYEVPRECFLVAMGNRDQDKGVTFKMPTPVMNRFVHFEMETDFEDWQVWAIGAMIHPQIIGYLTAFQSELFRFDVGTAARGFPTPRSWHAASDILKNAETSMNERQISAAMTGCVGEAAGLQFMLFRKKAEELPNVDDILSGKLTSLAREIEPSLAFALTTSMCYRLRDRVANIARDYGGGGNPLPRDQSQKKLMKQSKEFAEWLKLADNFLAFLLNNFKPEITIMGAKASLSVHDLPFDAARMRHFELFADRYKNFIIG